MFSLPNFCTSSKFFSIVVLLPARTELAAAPKPFATDDAYLCRDAQKVNKYIAVQYRRMATTIMPNSTHNLTNWQAHADSVVDCAQSATLATGDVVCLCRARGRGTASDGSGAGSVR